MWVFCFFVILRVIGDTDVLSNYLLIGSVVLNGTMHLKRKI